MGWVHDVLLKDVGEPFRITAITSCGESGENYGLSGVFKSDIQPFIELGWLERDGAWLRPTPNGLDALGYEIAKAA
jgi:hypothetical protein